MNTKQAFQHLHDLQKAGAYSNIDMENNNFDMDNRLRGKLSQNIPVEIRHDKYFAEDVLSSLNENDKVWFDEELASLYIISFEVDVPYSTPIYQELLDDETKIEYFVNDQETVELKEWSEELGKFIEEFFGFVNYQDKWITLEEYNAAK